MVRLGLDAGPLQLVEAPGLARQVLHPIIIVDANAWRRHPHWSDHRDLAAIRRGKPEAARDRMREHLEGVCGLLRRGADAQARITLEDRLELLRQMTSPMTRYVAFLRAINVGGHTVKMDRLRGLFEEMGLEGVSTFIASGNVIFESARAPGDLEPRISEHLRQALGYDVVPFVRTLEELSSIVSHAPFAEGEVAEADRLYVCFLPKAVAPQVAAAVEALSTPTQALRLRGRELYWLCRTRISESDVSANAVDRVLGVPTTMRNLNTVRRILAKFA